MIDPSIELAAGLGYPRQKAVDKTARVYYW
jgi:hypothetical protein